MFLRLIGAFTNNCIIMGKKVTKNTKSPKSKSKTSVSKTTIVKKSKVSTNNKAKLSKQIKSKKNLIPEVNESTHDKSVKVNCYVIKLLKMKILHHFILYVKFVYIVHLHFDFILFSGCVQ